MQCFQNNFHLLSVNWWQPWELGVKAPIYQPSFALWCWAFWNVHFRFLALHSGWRMGLVFLAIAGASERDLRSQNEPLILRIHCFQEHSFNLALVFIPQILQLQNGKLWIGELLSKTAQVGRRWFQNLPYSSNLTWYGDPWLWVFRFKAQTDAWGYTSNISILKGFSWFLASLHPTEISEYGILIWGPTSSRIFYCDFTTCWPVSYLVSFIVPVGLLGRIFLNYLKIFLFWNNFRLTQLVLKTVQVF